MKWDHVFPYRKTERRNRVPDLVVRDAVLSELVSAPFSRFDGNIAGSTFETGNSPGLLNARPAGFRQRWLPIAVFVKREFNRTRTATQPSLSTPSAFWP
jgi:hypothetical protein